MTKTVLMIEDEEDFQRIVERILVPSGFTLEKAASAEGGWESILRRAPDLALVDWNLPGQSGPEFCRKLRGDARFKNIPIILLTVRNLPDEHLRGLRESGADIYLTKPIDPEELLARIQSLFSLLGESNEQ